MKIHDQVLFKAGKACQTRVCTIFDSYGNIFIKVTKSPLWRTANWNHKHHGTWHNVGKFDGNNPSFTKALDDRPCAWHAWWNPDAVEVQLGTGGTLQFREPYGWMRISCCKSGIRKRNAFVIFKFVLKIFSDLLAHFRLNAGISRFIVFLPAYLRSTPTLSLTHCGKWKPLFQEFVYMRRGILQFCGQ